jgi:hypothetical protein
MNPRKIGLVGDCAVALLLAAGCGSGSAAPSGLQGSAGSGSGPARTASGSPSASPAPTIADTVALPLAVLETIGGGIAGTLGSYGMDGRGGDSPWLPFDGLPGVLMRAGEPIRIRFRDGAGIGTWGSEIAAAGDRDGQRREAAGQRGEGPASTFVEVGPLPTGRWVLAVQLVRADGRGEGVTYWAVTVR